MSRVNASRVHLKHILWFFAIASALFAVMRSCQQARELFEESSLEPENSSPDKKTGSSEESERKSVEEMVKKDSHYQGSVSPMIQQDHLPPRKRTHLDPLSMEEKDLKKRVISPSLSTATETIKSPSVPSP
ncbi:MAG: hypothetical protein HY399_03520 [Elusimicrobia bacterium]|nr:hypothetical protein [Elusimicrobiota bacterium]